MAENKNHDCAHGLVCACDRFTPEEKIERLARSAVLARALDRLLQEIEPDTNLHVNALVLLILKILHAETQEERDRMVEIVRGQIKFEMGYDDMQRALKSAMQ